MPILNVEVVGAAPADAAKRVADDVGEALGLWPGRLWVRLHRLAQNDYAENGIGAVTPTFVNVIASEPPIGAAREEQARQLAQVVGSALQRPPENVHVIYEPSAQGRVAFGGELVPVRPATVRTGVVWEDEVGYSRAVLDRDHVYVTGTAPVDSDGSVHAPGNAYAQARRCLEIIDSTLGKLGLTRSSVVRTRLFVTDIAAWAEFGRAHREYFGDHRPATTMVEVTKLIAEDMLIEIEVDARC